VIPQAWFDYLTSLSISNLFAEPNRSSDRLNARRESVLSERVAGCRSKPEHVYMSGGASAVDLVMKDRKVLK
jgi:hypothetical protein